MAICNLQVILSAAQCAYRVGSKEFIYDEQLGYTVAETVEFPKKEEYEQKLNSLKEKGYSIKRDVCPQNGGKTNLASALLVPNDDKSPLIITYRGTATSKDLLADLRLGLVGTVGKNFRQEAYDFYLEVKKEYPGREIVLTGHSLGGHLAQYVGARAYAEDAELKKNHSLYVRTFNTAPISTDHKSSLKKNLSVFNNFINYRLANDVISDLPVQEYYGKVFDIQCDKSFIDSHRIASIDEALPDKIKKQQVGSSETHSAFNNMIIETIRGIIESYRCRVRSQWFPGLSQLINIKLLNQLEKSITRDLEEGNYFKAKFALGQLNKLVSGKRTKQLVSFMFNMVCNAEAKAPNLYSFGQYTSKIKELIDKLSNLPETLEGEEYNAQASEILEQIKNCDQHYIESQGFNLEGQVLFSSQGQGDGEEDNRFGLNPNSALSETSISKMRNTKNYTSGALLDPQSKLRIVISPTLRAKQTACMIIPENTQADLSVETVLLTDSTPNWKSPLKYLLFKLSVWFYGKETSYILSDPKHEEVDEKLKTYQSVQEESIMSPRKLIDEVNRQEAMKILVKSSLSSYKDTWLFADSKSLQSYFNKTFKNNANFEDGETRRLYQVEGVNDSFYYIPPYHLAIDQKSGKWRGSFQPSSHKFSRTKQSPSPETIPAIESTARILLARGMNSGEQQEPVLQSRESRIEIAKREEDKQDSINLENSESVNFQL